MTLDLDPMYAAAETLPYIDDLIKAGELNKKNAELTGGDWNPAGLLEAINWDDPYPYGKIDSIVTSTIKSYNPDFTDADVNDAYSAFYGWLQKQEDLPDDMGVQEWYDNAVENFRDADQYERRGMDEDEEAAAEEGYKDAIEKWDKWAKLNKAGKLIGGFKEGMSAKAMYQERVALNPKVSYKPKFKNFFKTS